jgi:signal transduction histidine kinase
MQLTPATRPRRRPARLDVALLATAGLLLALTLVPYLDPALNIVIVDRTLDVVLTSLTMIGTGGLAVLAVMRYRETGRLASFVQASAFALWFAYTAVTVVLVVLRLDGPAGLSLGLPEQVPAWGSGITRIAVAGLFMLSGVAALQGIYGRARRRIRRIFVPAVFVGAVTLLLYLVRIPFPDLLPAYIEPEGIQALLARTTDLVILPGVTVVALGMVVATITGLVAAVVLYRITWARGGPASDAFTAVGLVILAVAEVQHALWPSVYSGLVTASDIMRLAAYIVLAAGVIADQRSDLRALRSAYTALDRMRTTEAERAILEERSRLAREIHDGLAQHLWFAKLKMERLASTLSEEDRPLAAEVSQALDTAIVEAREALVTMRSGAEQDMAFSDMLARTVDDFGDRSGLRVAATTSTTVPTSLPPRIRVEVLRVISEALTNVRKHADATMVRVSADVQEGDLVISVTDNGRGFDIDAVNGQGLGLQGMQERARLVGGTLVIISEPSGGTTIELRAPLPAAPLTASVPAPLAAVETGPEGSPFGASLDDDAAEPGERIEPEPGRIGAGMPMRIP